MWKRIILESPGVVEATEYEEKIHTDWQVLIDEARQNGIETELLSSAVLYDVSAMKILCTGEDCLPRECLLLAADEYMLSAAEQVGMPCVAYGETVPAFRTKYQITTQEGAEFYYLSQIYQRLVGEPVIIAETEHLMIREMTVEDAEALWEMQNQEEVRRYTEGVSEDRQIELEKHRAYVEHVYPMYGYGLWGVYHKKDGKLIGRCGIQDYEYNGVWEFELGYLLDPAVWGCGYATEAVNAVIKYAFERMNIQSVVSLIVPENERSIRLAKRVGMQFERLEERNGKPVLRYVIYKSQNMDK